MGCTARIKIGYVSEARPVADNVGAGAPARPAGEARQFRLANKLASLPRQPGRGVRAYAVRGDPVHPGAQGVKSACARPEIKRQLTTRGSQAANLLGGTLSHYRITAAIGAGGMGEVYRATDTKLGRDVALKVLPAEMARDPERLARFQREARAVAALNHPHIVTLYSVEEAEGVHFLTMELIEGQSLEHRIRAGGLALDQIIEIASALAQALAAAHEKGIVHRDLKPANVMVTDDGRVKVLDFGLAKDVRVDKSSDATLTSAAQTAVGVVMGTLPYMSPEQIAGRAIDHRTDIFSLGVVLYEMTSGRRPFEGESSAELASAILRDTPRALNELRLDVPEELSRVIRRCLEKNPADRFSSAREIRDGLRRVIADSPSMGPAPVCTRCLRSTRGLPGLSRGSGSQCCRSSTAALTLTSRTWPPGCPRTS